MKKIIFTIILSALAGQAFSQQQYREDFAVALPDSLREAQAEWVDLDNDGLLDMLAIVKNQADESYLMVIKGDTVLAPVLQPGPAIVDYQSYTLMDYDRDNRMDIVVSGIRAGTPRVAVYINQGDLSFHEMILSQPAAFSLSRFADLTNDGRMEWITSGELNGERFINIYQEQDGQWVLVHDSLKLKATCLEIVDADNNGVQDLFISGAANDNSPFTGFLINNGDFFFTPLQEHPWAGSGSSTDLNHDGISDVVLSGTDDHNNSLIRIFRSREDSLFSIANVPLALTGSQVFAADLSSDGEADLNYLGKNISGDTVNLLQYDVSDYDTLPSHGIVCQRFGDLEHDGDLDLLQVVKDSSLRLVVMRNENIVRNNGPVRPPFSVALTVYDRLFLYWDESWDDHTERRSLTYDVFLGSGSTPLQAGGFDMINGRRMTVSPGNNGTHHFKLLSHIPPEDFQYAVQSVDNSFHTYTRDGGGGVCFGAGGMICVQTEAQTISLCSKESVQLSAPHEVLWFSFANGFLGSSTRQDFQGEEQDTVFYFDRAQDGCLALNTWILELNNAAKKTEHATRYACEGAALEFTVEPGWDQVQWESLHGPLGTADRIQYQLTQPDSIFVSLTNAEGCRIIRKTALFTSKPVVTITADDYEIVRGSEVQLIASGAAHYFWEPATGLSAQDIPDPIATPVTTTTYTVTGFDSLECTDKSTVVIVVDGAGFIPTLFTPNDDGKNDLLKIYGLTGATDFSFRLYNREGNLVYRANSIPEAVSGWDGTVSGVKQPGGVYFWKVNGELFSGDKLLLNGKKSGSIVLIR